MKNKFVTFQRFNDMELAKIIAEKLQSENISFTIENNSNFFDPSFARKTIDADILLKIAQIDFPKAHEALASYYKQQLDDVEPGYYLFEFSNQELMAIISKPDEWGSFDFQLAKKILNDRGIEVSKEKETMLKTQRNKELAAPENLSVLWIVTGYLLAIVFSFAGLFLGWMFAYFKKTLPDGREVYAYSEKDRKYGKGILIVAIILTAYTLIVRMLLLHQPVKYFYVPPF